MVNPLIEEIRRRIEVSGLVQGVGYRPFVRKVAVDLGLTGWVSNSSAGALIEVQGPRPKLDEFLRLLREHMPPLAVVDEVVIHSTAIRDEVAFSIVESIEEPGESTSVSAEIATCEDCFRELRDKANRRYRYPFINCTNCGPRFTIIKDLPYDRVATTMNAFAMCPQCQSEYDNPSDRRFHAQPNACHSCGPHIWLVESPLHASDVQASPLDRPKLESVVHRFQELILRGCIVAVKGIGGFHLVCDASNAHAVQSLRQRKGHVDKPFAIMTENLGSVGRFAFIDPLERDLLLSTARPIVLLKKRPEAEINALCFLDSVAPRNDLIGVMLPYSPLHAVLVENMPPLVMTSGNLTDETIARENSEAMKRLGSIADAFLLHNREIHVVCDDSVVHAIHGYPTPIRRSRGYTPLPVRLKLRPGSSRKPDSRPTPSVLAVGGEFKATFCATKHDYAYISQHIGDMGNLETLDAMRRSVDHFLRLFRIEPDVVAADCHPEYLSSLWAREYADSRGATFLPVSHHHAHVAALIAEHGLPWNEPIIGVCFDGTGYGTDGTIWGGEFLLASGVGFNRLAHLECFPLPGGDAAIRHPYRVALALLYAANIPWDPNLPCVDFATAPARKVLRQQLERNIACPRTSSMGRLFDAVASLIGVRHSVSYEAQAAIELESLATSHITESAVSEGEYSFRSSTNLEHDEKQTKGIAVGCLIQQIVRDVRLRVPPSIIAARFHHAVAGLIEAKCLTARAMTGVNRVGLTGGVFQNALLAYLAQERLSKQGFEILTHHLVPPNDGGLALGQAYVALNQLNQ